MHGRHCLPSYLNILPWHILMVSIFCAAVGFPPIFKDFIFLLKIQKLINLMFHYVFYTLTKLFQISFLNSSSSNKEHFLHAKYCHKCFALCDTKFNSHNCAVASSTNTPILQMRKQKHRAVMWLAQASSAS